MPEQGAERESGELQLPSLAAVVTPNLPEATRLAGFNVGAPEDMRRAAEAIHSYLLWRH